MSGCHYPPDIITNTIIIGICLSDFSLFLVFFKIFFKLDTNQFFLDYVVVMNEDTINRASLEKLSFSDLVQLADEYGVDVPEDLDRRFLIAELLELAEESNNREDEMIIASESDDQQPLVLNGNFNETQVSCVLRNPAWLFVFWNLNTNDAARIADNPASSLRLRICSLTDPKDLKPEEAFEVQTPSQSQEQYVLLPKGKKYIKVELVYVTGGAGEVIAFSPVITIPQGASVVKDLQPGREEKFSPVAELSGIKELLTEQYKNHRHSFS